VVNPDGHQAFWMIWRFPMFGRLQINAHELQLKLLLDNYFKSYIYIVYKKEQFAIIYIYNVRPPRYKLVYKPQ